LKRKFAVSGTIAPGTRSMTVSIFWSQAVPRSLAPYAANLKPALGFRRRTPQTKAPGWRGPRRLDASRLNDYCGSVKITAKSPRPRAAICPEEVVFLDLLRTTDMLSRRFVPILKREHLSATQYNVLRILRGAQEALPCGEIANRMITRDPDITRLLDRLEQRGLISRSREARDRRTVLVRIMPKGLKLLGRLDEPVRDAHRRQLGHLGAERLGALADLLGAARQEAV